MNSPLLWSGATNFFPRRFRSPARCAESSSENENRSCLAPKPSNPVPRYSRSRARSSVVILGADALSVHLQSSGRACRLTACLPSAGLNDLLSFYGCGTDRPCELLQRRCAPVVPTAVYTSLDSLCHTVMAVARAPPVFLYAMIHQHRCCASVTHRAPKPRLAQLRPRSPVCALTGLAVCPAKFDLLTPFPPGLPVREAFLSEP